MNRRTKAFVEDSPEPKYSLVNCACALRERRFAEIAAAGFSLQQLWDAIASKNAPAAYVIT